MQEAPQTVNRPTYRRRTRFRTEIKARKRSESNAAQLFVDFSIPDHFRSVVNRPWIVRVIVEAIWQHLIYARGILPVPYHQILASKLPEKRLTTVDRKLKRVKESIRVLCEDWRDVSSCLDVSKVLVVTGACLARPREVHVVDFAGLAADTSSPHSATPLTRKQYTLSTRVVRDLVRAECDADSFFSSRELLSKIQRASSDQLIICVGVQRDSFDQVYSREHPLPGESSFASDATQTHIFDKLTVRNYLDVEEILSQKSVHRIGRIGVIEAESVAPLNKDSSLVWCALRSTVKGFRLPASPRNANA